MFGQHLLCVVCVGLSWLWNMPRINAICICLCKRYWQYLVLALMRLMSFCTTYPTHRPLYFNSSHHCTVLTVETTLTILVLLSYSKNICLYELIKSASVVSKLYNIFMYKRMKVFQYQHRLMAQCCKETTFKLLNKTDWKTYFHGCHCRTKRFCSAA